MPTRPSISTARSRACAFETSWWVRTASTSCVPILYIGCSELSGSWKIIATGPPRTLRSSSSEAVSSSWPSKRIEPVIVAFCERVRPMTVIELTDLPEPDSPTIPSVCPASTV